MTRLLAAVTSVVLSGCSCNGFEVPPLPEKVLGTCTYTNKFSQLTECKDYVGEWSEKEATEDCKSNGANIVLAQKCGIAPAEKFGDCIFIVDEAKQKFARVELPGTDSAKCASMERGCELFGGGSFQPSTVCGGLTGLDGPSGLPTFQQPTLDCKEPLAGEPAGKGPDGKVCSWSMISGATEEGRDFNAYGNCDMVRTQRPYYPAPPAPDSTQADARMEDPAYAADVQWVKNQIQSTACVCCHSTVAPKGSSNWFLESGPNFFNSFFPRGLAMGAGWIDTVGFGAFPPEQNNGFTRATPMNPNHTIFVTTDDARMKRIFEAELAFRGKSRADFADQVYGAGPLDAQRFYVPQACDSGEGVAADGTITWIGGKARYVYVMDMNATSPGVPPNLDIPMGTQWRIDVPWMGGTPIESGSVKYGVVPDGLSQRSPLTGAPAPLEAGKQYYLYVLQDIAIPVTRCLFTMP
ncbi:MAG: hypothetical protein Q8N23_35900 [Archangium sp.]|nr:hypothetical protein [Archangium sp.]MDP3570482.1 hypothetical protein [Archangium sp.]